MVVTYLKLYFKEKSVFLINLLLYFCPTIVDGKWPDWSPWSSCDVTCGKGTLVRYRSCNNPAPQNGGLYCHGQGIEQKTCILKLCPGKYASMAIKAFRN